METEQELKEKDTDPTNDVAYAASNGATQEAPSNDYADIKFRIVGNPGSLFGALAEAQADFSAVEKTGKVSFSGSRGGKVEFDYATLAAILESTRSPLNDHGLTVTQPLSMTARGNHVVVTILGHKSGAYMMMEATVPQRQDPKETGALITYLRRYTLQSLLGVAAGDEGDEQVLHNLVKEGFETADKRAPAGGKVELLASPRTGEEFTDTQRKHLESHGLKRADDQDTEVWTATAGAGRAAHIESKLRYAAVTVEQTKEGK